LIKIKAASSNDLNMFFKMPPGISLWMAVKFKPQKNDRGLKI